MFGILYIPQQILQILECAHLLHPLFVSLTFFWYMYTDNTHIYASAYICTDSLRKDTQETHFSNLPPGKGPG